MIEASAAPGPFIGIADDHPIMRTALRSALQALGPQTRFVEASDAASALALIGNEPDLDLLLLDLNMPGMSGLDAVRAVRASAPQLPLAVISAEQQAGIADALLQLGVAGFIPKSDPPEVIVSAVRLVLAGGVYVPPHLLNGRAVSGPTAAPAGAEAANLTVRQRDVLRLLAQGMSNKVIARELGVSEGTVKVHLLAVFRALDVRNRTAAVLAAQRLFD
jgi:DNA-binding NarL/FixJ family response regulator